MVTEIAIFINYLIFVVVVLFIYLLVVDLSKGEKELFRKEYKLTAELLIKKEKDLSTEKFAQRLAKVRKTKIVIAIVCAMIVMLKVYNVHLVNELESKVTNIVNELETK